MKTKTETFSIRRYAESEGSHCVAYIVQDLEEGTFSIETSGLDYALCDDIYNLSFSELVRTLQGHNVSFDDIYF